MPHFLAIMVDTRVDHIEGEGPSLIGRDWLQHNYLSRLGQHLHAGNRRSCLGLCHAARQLRRIFIPFSSQHSNPLYVTPQTEYKNPILEKSDEAEEDY